MSTTGKPGGFLSGLPNPVARKPAAPPIVVSPEAEQAFGLGPAPEAPLPPAAAPPETHAPPPPAPRNQPSAAEPERSKTFFLPYSLCERLEMQKLSERREMKHIVRQALEEYFDRNPVRQAVREVFRD
jgi:hypothetical protein